MSSFKPSTLRLKFDGFAHLPSEPGAKVHSEWMTDCHGNEWNVCLYPGGVRFRDVRDDPFVGACLSVGEGSFVAKASFVLRDARGKVYCEKITAQYCFEAAGGVRVGARKFVRRSEVLNEANGILADGALLFDVYIQYAPFPRMRHKPSGSLANKMLQLLENEEGDVSFKVGGSVFAAHKLILKMSSSVLFNFCEENDDGSPIPINGTTPEMFRIILRYTYGEEVPDTKTILASGKEIIDAADKFGAVDLKVAVETELVNALVIDVNSAADWITFADAKTCPLLKEQATAYFVSRSRDILNSESSEKLKESSRLLTELMLEVASDVNGDDRFGVARDSSVGDLRERLYKRGLDVDGSKEMLASRLRESNKRCKVE